MVDTIDIGGLAETVFARPGVIVLTLLGAWLVSRVVRRTVKYLVRRLRSRRVQERLGRVRRRTPSALLDTGTLQVPRATERVEALAAALSSAAGFVVWWSRSCSSSISSTYASARCWPARAWSAWRWASGRSR